MEVIKLNDQYIQPFVSEQEIEQITPYAQLALSQLLEGKGAGNDFIDWVQWPTSYDKDEFRRIKQTAQKIQSDSDVLVVIGIGGSYLGARAAIDFLSHTFYNEVSSKRGCPKIYFLGNHLSSKYLNDLLEVIGEQDFSINVISKSGTTTEPAIAFRILKEKLIRKYGKEEANRRIYATTDQEKGALRSEADENGYETFVIPSGIGGRFTVLTAVGLLPIAVAGLNIEALMGGAEKATALYQQEDVSKNEAIRYAMIRNILHRKGKQFEILANYEPNLRSFGEWWKQLFGESEGKDHKGIFPTTANFTTDLHSIGQIIQDGPRNLFETVLTVKESPSEVRIMADEKDLDGLNYLENKTLAEVNQKAFQGTLMAHTDGGVPNVVIELADMTEVTLGQLIYFFEMAVAISGYLNGVNPFDQPGVEAYKRNMFALLEKPGYEKLADQG